MTTQKQIQKVIEIAQEKGWYVSVDDKKMSNISFEFQRFTNQPRPRLLPRRNARAMFSWISMPAAVPFMGSWNTRPMYLARLCSGCLEILMPPICGLVKTDMAKKAHPITSRI